MEIHLPLSPSIRASESHSSEKQREARRVGRGRGPPFGMDRPAQSLILLPQVKRALVHQLPPLSRHRPSPGVAEIPDSQGRATTDTHNWEPASLVLISASILDVTLGHITHFAKVRFHPLLKGKSEQWLFRHSPGAVTGAAVVGHSDLPAARKGLVDSPQMTRLQFLCSAHNQDTLSLH